MKRLLDQWERKNSKAKGQQTVDDWEREIADDEVMRDASPPPAPPSQPVVSDDSVELPAPLLPGQVEALETVGICMLVEYMLAPPGAEEPQQLRAFWPDASAATPVPAQNTEVLHDFMFRLFATCMAVWKSTSVSRAPDNSSLSHFSAMTRLSWLGRAARNRYRHAIEQASRRWRGGRRNDSARTRSEMLISTQTATAVQSATGLSAAQTTFAPAKPVL